MTKKGEKWSEQARRNNLRGRWPEYYEPKETKTETETWFAFTAHNRQPLYGYGTVIEADKYCLQLNIGLEKWFFAYHSMADEGFSLAIALADMAEG